MRPNLDSGELLQVTSTVAAIAIALATLGVGTGPVWWDIETIPAVFLVSGLVALLGSVSAMIDLCREQGMTLLDVIGYPRRGSANLSSAPNRALLCGLWGMLLLGVAYIAMTLELARGNVF